MVLEMLTGILASQLAIGALVGFLMGFALKKMTKVVLVLAGLFFAGIAYLEYNQFVSVNYEKFGLTINDLLQRIDTNFVLPNFLAMNMPLFASFGAAMALGIKKG